MVKIIKDIRKKTTNYKIAQINVKVDEDGQTQGFVLDYLGLHVAQGGGKEFGYGSEGSDSLEWLLERLKDNFEESRDTILKAIEKKSFNTK